ncbi:DUF1631 family protein [Uliginosibacterium paludis]|uniref:DUF1631 family protein n=1 Tax=Uliginosibacterium paludis TaxID=1615952 RepID=A0ABV2CNM5_9RHOO
METRQLLELSRSRFAATLVLALRECGLRLPPLLQAVERAAGSAFDELAELRSKEDYQRKRSVTASRISLVHPEDMDLTVDLINLSHALTDACERELPRLHLLFMRLLDQHNAVQDQLPVGPEAVCIALRGLCDSGELPPDLRQNLPRLAQPHLIEALRLFYADLTRELGDSGVEPASLTRSGQAPAPTRPPGGEDVFAGPPGSLGHGGGYSAAGQNEVLESGHTLDGPLGRLQSRLMRRQAAGAGASAAPSLDPALLAAIMERVFIWLTERQQSASTTESTNLTELRPLLPAPSNAAIDAIGMAFDVLGSDTRLCAPVRASLARLRLPVSKVALMAGGFPASLEHPPRRFLETVLRLGFSLPPQTGEEHPVCQAIETATRRIQQEFELDQAIFSEAGASLEALETRLLAAHAEACAALLPQARHEAQREHSRHHAARAIRALCTGTDLPRPVRVFLEQLWIRVLAVIHQHGGGDKSGAWLRALHTANQLVESVEPRDINSRDALLSSLPPLLAELRAGLDAIGVPEALRERAFKSFASVHSAIIHGRKPDNSPDNDIMSASPPRVEPINGLPGAFVLRLPPTAEPDRGLPDWVGQLVAGQCLDLEVPEHGWRRLRLSWVEGHPRVLLGATLDGDFRLILPAHWLGRSGIPAGRPIPMQALFELAAETAEQRAAG